MSSGSHSLSERLQNSTLLTQSLVPETHSRHGDHLGLCIVHILMALWVCLANSSQIVNVLLCPRLRHQPKNLLVVNVCVIELVIGGFLCPLYSDSLMQGTWRHHVVTCIVYEVVFYAQVSISTLAVLVVVVERFYYLLTPRMMEGSGTRLVTFILIALPWVVGSSLVVPMFLSGTTATFNELANSCQILWKRKYQAVTVFVSFFCPAFLLLSMTAAVVMLYVIFSVIAKRRNLGPNPERSMIRDSLRVVLLSSFTCVILQFPFFIVLLIEMFCQNNGGRHSACGHHETTWAVAMTITMLKPGVMPLTWLAYTDIRSGFKMDIRAMCHQERHPGSNRQMRDDSETLNNHMGLSDRTVATTTM